MQPCRICANSNLEKIFSLGNQPLANNLLKEPGTVEAYPLELYRCPTCQLIQLGYVVPKEKMFDTYLYVPSASKTNLAHFDHLAQMLVSELKLKMADLVVDIGSSDGSFLKEFAKRSMTTVGVEPAKNLAQSANFRGRKQLTAEEAIRTGHYTFNAYFTTELAKKIYDTFGKRASLVTTTNVFAHVDDLHAFAEGLDELLDDDGVFFAQFPDVRNLFESNQFDTIYHEHLSYFTYEPLYYFFSQTPFEIFKITSDQIHGGSMQIWVRRRKDILKQFSQNVGKIKDILVTYLKDQNKKGKRIVGYGAAAKGTVLLNYCGLDSTIIDYVVDDTPWKQGKYIPGVNIPIVPATMLDEKKPDIMLVLAWNFKEEIMEKNKDRGLIFVVPIPKVEIIP